MSIAIYTDNPAAVGRRIRQARRQCGDDATTVAAQHKISTFTLLQIERGQAGARPSRRTADAIESLMSKYLRPPPRASRTVPTHAVTPLPRANASKNGASVVLDDNVGVIVTAAHNEMLGVLGRMDALQSHMQTQLDLHTEMLRALSTAVSQITASLTTTSQGSPKTARRAVQGK